MLIKPPAGFIVAVAAMLAFAAGWTINGWRYKGREAKALEQAYAERDAANAKANGLAADYELIETALNEYSRDTAAKVKVIYRDRKVSADCAVPAGAASLLDDTRNNANAAITGKPSNALSADPGSANE